MNYLLSLVILVTVTILAFYLGYLIGESLSKLDRSINKLEYHKKYGRVLSFVMGSVYVSSFIGYLVLVYFVVIKAMDFIHSLLRTNG
jgi:cytochrome c biogenesis protein CcdA